MKRVVGVIVILFILLSSFTLAGNGKEQIGAHQAIVAFKESAEAYTKSINALTVAIQRLDSSDTTTTLHARAALADCRLQYKHIEYFVEYFFENRIKIFNLPPVYEIEEPYMEYQHPVGMQVIEAYLFDEHPAENKAALVAETEVLHTTASSLPQLLYGREITDEEVLEAVRLEVIRVITLGITGYDAPELKTGISEAQAAFESLKTALQPYAMGKDSVGYYIDKAIGLLNANHDFTSFKRLQFITEATTPLQQHLDRMIADMGLGLHTVSNLNYKSPSLFANDALDITSFSTDTFVSNEALVSLGRELFFEKRLSGNGKRSCATCHQPDKYFTDGLAKSLALDEKAHVSRNAPTLLYAGFQHGQFLDARSASMTEQVKVVLANPEEMNASFTEVVKTLKKDKYYKSAFRSAFVKDAKKDLFTIDHIAQAITAYERSLPVMTSRFDEYMNGNKGALTANEQKGFDLFMGKALCGTCHFAPVFNALLPPYYNITELESLGVLESPDLKHPVADVDSGRYKVFPIEFYVGAFKTPTVRNIAKTAPYMHNGVFKTLEEVVEFYNEGGGNGLGLNNPYQTLSSNKLDLSKDEIKNIVAFMESLTDKPLSLPVTLR